MQAVTSRTNSVCVYLKVEEAVCSPELSVTVY